MTTARWLLDVLDRELVDMIGAERDALATKILDALPVELIGKAIEEAAAGQLRANGLTTEEDRAVIARDIAGNAAMAVVGALAVDEDIEPTEGRSIQ